MKSTFAPRALAGVLILLCICAVAADAEVAIIDDGNNPAIIEQGPEGAIVGYAFKIGPNDLQITALGLWDDDSVGFADSHDVELWNGDVLLAAVRIPAGTGARLFNEFRYVELALPVTLAGNGGARITFKGFSGSSDKFRNASGSPGPTFSSDIVAASSFYSYQYPGDEFPTHLVGGSPYAGPTFEYHVVPEPASAALLLFGAISILCCRRATSYHRNA